MDPAIQTARIGAVPRTFLAALVVLSAAFAGCGAMAGLDNGSETSIGQRSPASGDTNAEADQRFLALFRAAPLSLTRVISLAERLHAGSRTVAIAFDTSATPAYRVRTVKNGEIWDNLIDAGTGKVAGPESTWSLNELEAEERDNIIALRSVVQELPDAVAIAEKAAAGKAISGGLVTERHQVNFVVVVLSDDRVKEVFLQPPRALSKSGPTTARKN
jgi:uncharacterized membrane protein YkoI